MILTSLRSADWISGQSWETKLGILFTNRSWEVHNDKLSSVKWFQIKPEAEASDVYNRIRFGTINVS